MHYWHKYFSWEVAELFSKLNYGMRTIVGCLFAFFVVFPVIRHAQTLPGNQQDAREVLRQQERERAP